MNKRLLIPLFLFVALTFGAILTQSMAIAGPMGPNDGDERGMMRSGDCRGPNADGERGERRLAMMTEMLDLTSTQQTQIKEIFTTERSRRDAGREQHQANHEQLHQLLQAQPLDENAVRAQTALLAQQKADNLIARAKVHQQVLTILTPEQQVKAEKLKDLMGKGQRGHKRHGKGMGF